jgi:pseudaminic acid cytidylyltransferase
MIGYPIRELKKSGLFEEIIVSTDDLEIAEISMGLGADRIVDRPRVLAENSTPTIEVVSQAIEFLGIPTDSDVCTVYATNPLLTSSILKASFKFYQSEEKSHYATSVVKYGFPPQRSLSRGESGIFSMVDESKMYLNSQDLAPIFHETSQLWWGKANRWIARIGMQLDLRGLVLPEWMVQDIDNEDDWLLAEAKYDYLIKYPERALKESEILEYNSSYGIKLD